jgi:tRNA (adenine37-N6)-methyltransferase
MKIELAPIGVVFSTRVNVEDDDWDRERSYIKLTTLPAEALAGLEEFSHVEVLFYMNQVDPAKLETAARHPRNNTAWPKVGILAQRAKNRPNQIGATICQVLHVIGDELHVAGLDAVDGTPVLDIKPWVQAFGPRGALREPAWIKELMRGYWQQE